MFISLFHLESYYEIYTTLVKKKLFSYLYKIIILLYSGSNICFGKVMN